jgi:hypothetical protein
MARALTHHTTCQFVDLSGNPTISFAQLLVLQLHNRFVLSLDAPRRGLSDADAVAIAVPLKANMTITHVDLGYNNIEAAGCDALLQAVTVRRHEVERRQKRRETNQVCMRE